MAYQYQGKVPFQHSEFEAFGLTMHIHRNVIRGVRKRKGPWVISYKGFHMTTIMETVSDVPAEFIKRCRNAFPQKERQAIVEHYLCMKARQENAEQKD